MKKLLTVAIGVAVAIAVIAVFGQQANVTTKEYARQETMVPQPQTSKIKVIASFYPL